VETNRHVLRSDMIWDEMTPTEFIEIREKGKGCCVLPVASIERHGGLFETVAVMTARPDTVKLAHAIPEERAASRIV
jgi:hypothetical protein